MRGTILGVHDGRGVLLSADDRRLEFPIAEWRSGGQPTSGQAVDFVEEQGRAHSVFAVPYAAMQPRSSSYLLGIIAVVCLGLGFVIPLFPTIFAFVLGVIGAQRAREDRDETGLLLSRIAWIGALVLFVFMALAAVGLLVLFGIFAASDFSLGPID